MCLTRVLVPHRLPHPGSAGEPPGWEGSAIRGSTPTTVQVRALYPGGLPG
jgi:hypothetical protein